MGANFDRRILHAILVEPDSEVAPHTLDTGLQSRFFESISSIEYYASTRVNPETGNENAALKSIEAIPSPNLKM